MNLNPKSMKPALIVVDVQNDFKKGASDYQCPQLDKNLLANINELVVFCRSKKIPIIFTQHSIKSDKSNAEHGEPDSIRACIEDTSGWKVAQEIDSSPEDNFVTKHKFDAFYESELGDVLKNLGVNTVIICGVWTNNCVRSTAEGAYYRDYDLILVSDCCGGVDFVDGEDHQKVSDYTLQELAERTYNTKLLTLNKLKTKFYPHISIGRIVELDARLST
jgi:nicotinamidase-related amidase